MANPETLGTIITAGLAGAANPGLSTEALAFVKRLFRHIYTTRDLSFLITSATPTLSGHTISLSALTTFRSVYMLKLSTIEQPLQEAPYKDLYPKIKHAEDYSLTGVPTHFTTEFDRSALILYPRPASSYTVTLKYYAAPATSSWTTSTNIEFEDALAVQEAVTEWAMRYDKEPLSMLTERIANDLMSNYLNRHEPAGRATQQTLRWGRNFNKVKGD